MEVKRLVEIVRKGCGEAEDKCEGRRLGQLAEGGGWRDQDAGGAERGGEKGNRELPGGLKRERESRQGLAGRVGKDAERIGLGQAGRNTGKESAERREETGRDTGRGGGGDE